MYMYITYITYTQSDTDGARGQSDGAAANGAGGGTSDADAVPQAAGALAPDGASASDGAYT